MIAPRSAGGRAPGHPGPGARRHGDCSTPRPSQRQPGV